MKRRYIALVGFLFLTALCVPALDTHTAAAFDSKTDFRKGIKKHADWVERFKETHDYRIFKILAWRAGRVVDTELAREACDVLKDNPEQIDEVFERWGITIDQKEFEKDAESKWKSQHRDALVLKSSHYLLLATKGDEKYAKLIKGYMEKVFKLYQSKFKTKEKIEGRFLIKLYGSREKYVAGGGPETSVAYFSASGRELVGYVPRGPRFPTEEELIRETVMTFFHEGFHQYLTYFVPDPPTWVNEGFACLFEGLKIKKGRISEGKYISEYYRDWLKQYIKENTVTPISEFLYLTQAEYYAKQNVHYCQGWGLVHFLALGSPDYNKYYKRVLTNLKNGMDREEAIRDVFSKVNLYKLDEAYRAYVMGL